MRRRSAFPAVAAACALAGIVVGWSARDQQCQRERMALILDRSLERAATAADGLSCLSEGQDDGARKVLERDLAAAVTDASRMVRRGAVPDPTEASLEEGMRRAYGYASGHHMTELAAKAKLVLDALAHAAGPTKP